MGDFKNVSKFYQGAERGRANISKTSPLAPRYKEFKENMFSSVENSLLAMMAHEIQFYKYFDEESVLYRNLSDDEIRIELMDYYAENPIAYIRQIAEQLLIIDAVNGDSHDDDTEHNYYQKHLDLSLDGNSWLLTCFVNRSKITEFGLQITLLEMYKEELKNVFNLPLKGMQGSDSNHDSQYVDMEVARYKKHMDRIRYYQNMIIYAFIYNELPEIRSGNSTIMFA